MTRSKIKQRLAQIRGRIAELQEKERALAVEEEMADDAANMKLIKKHRISPERLKLLNSLREEEVRRILERREAELNENEDREENDAEEGNEDTEKYDDTEQDRNRRAR